MSDPKYPTLAAGFAEGAVGAAHVRKVAEILDKIPHRLPHDRTVAAEKTLAELAREHTPAELTTLGMRLLAHLDPDGELTDAKDRARRRNLWLNRQDAQKMSKLTANLDPQTRALLEMMLAVWAKPGMNNPDDPDSPSGGEDDADIEQVKAAAARDSRSQAQRNHDALNALLTAVFADGLLGKTHRGLPVSLIIKANLADLIREVGVGDHRDRVGHPHPRVDRAGRADSAVPGDLRRCHRDPVVLRSRQTVGHPGAAVGVAGPHRWGGVLGAWL